MIEAADLATCAPGPDVVTAITGLEFDDLSNDDRLDVVVALERQIAWLTSLQHRLVAQLRPSLVGVSSDDDWVQEELGAALRLAPTTAGHRLRVARDLTSRLPATLAALGAGDLSPTQAGDIATATTHLDAGHAGMVEQRVLPKATEQSAGQTRRALKRAVLAVDPAGTVEREALAVQERRVLLIAGDDGMAEVKAYLPAVGARVLMTAIRGLADKSKTPGDRRTHDQRQADALVDLGYAVLDSGTLPTQHGRPARLSLTMTAHTLAGAGDEPAELDGYGPISAATARDLLAKFIHPSGTQNAARVALTLCPVDEAGQVRGAPPAGTSSYELPVELRSFVLARDRRCTFPHCTIAATRCDLDHIVAFSKGGTSSADNLHPLCRRHHRAKHQLGWFVRRCSNGNYEWTTPSGKMYQSPTPSYPVDSSTARSTTDEQTTADNDSADVTFDGDITQADRFIDPQFVGDPSWVPWAQRPVA